MPTTHPSIHPPKPPGPSPSVVLPVNECSSPVLGDSETRAETAAADRTCANRPSPNNPTLPTLPQPARRTPTASNARHNASPALPQPGWLAGMPCRTSPHIPRSRNRRWSKAIGTLRSSLSIVQTRCGCGYGRRNPSTRAIGKCILVTPSARFGLFSDLDRGMFPCNSEDEVPSRSPPPVSSLLSSAFTFPLHISFSHLELHSSCHNSPMALADCFYADVNGW